MRTLWGALALTLLFGCGQGPPEAVRADNVEAYGRLSAGPVDVSWTLPVGTLPSDVVLGAEHNLTLRDRAVVQSGDLANAGPQTVVGNNAAVAQDVVSVGNVRVWHRANIDGTVFTEGRVHKERSATVGAVDLNAALSPPATESASLDVPDVSNGTLHLEPDRTATAAPGRYDALIVKSRSTVNLSSGTYFLDRLQLEPQSKLVINPTGGPVIFVVGDTAILRGDIETSDGSDPDVTFVYLGHSALRLERSFEGVVLAPDSELVLTGNRTVYRGAFFASRIDVTPDVTVEHVPFDPLADFGFRIRKPANEQRIDVNYTGLNSTSLSCETGLVAIESFDANGDFEGYENIDYVTPPANNEPGTDGCVDEAVFCDTNGVPLVDQPDLPLDVNAAGTCEDRSATIDDDCGIDVTTIGATCDVDSDCAANERCVDCGALDGCAEDELRCAQLLDTCDAFDAIDDCYELELCPDPEAGKPLPTAQEFASRFATPTTTPVTTTEQDIPAVLPLPTGQCLADAGATIVRNPGTKTPSEGSKLWAFDLESDFDKYANVTEMDGGIQKIEAGVKARVGASATILGARMEILSAGVSAVVDPCELSAGLYLRIGFDDADGTQNFAEPASTQRCKDLFASLSNEIPNLAAELDVDPTPVSQGGFFPTPQPSALRDALDNISAGYRDLTQVYDYIENNGVNEAICKQTLPRINNAICNVNGCAPCTAGTITPALTNQVIDYWRGLYDTRISDYQGIRNEALNTLNALSFTRTFRQDTLRDNYILRGPAIPIPIGPFSIIIEAGVGGGWALPLVAEIRASPTSAQPLVLAGGLDPQAAALAEIYVGFGIDLGVASFSIGLQTNLEIIEVTLPIRANVAMTRTNAPENRLTSLLPTQRLPLQPISSYDYDYGFGVDLAGEILGGSVSASLRVRFLFFSARFSRQLARWDGLQLGTINLIGTGTALNGVSLPGIPGATPAVSQMAGGGRYGNEYEIPLSNAPSLALGTFPNVPVEPGAFLNSSNLGGPCQDPIIIR